MYLLIPFELHFLVLLLPFAQLMIATLAQSTLVLGLNLDRNLSLSFGVYSPITLFYMNLSMNERPL